jgi:hypothetical protein
MHLPSVSHTSVINKSHSLGNAIGSHFIQGTARLPMKLHISFFIMLTVTNI